MGRIIEAERLPTVNAFLAHYAEAEAINGAPILIVDGRGRPQLVGLRDQYQDLQHEWTRLSDAQIPLLVAEREAIWGTRPDDDAGVWFQLRNYKSMVQLRLGGRHPLTKTVPNLGELLPGTLVSVCYRFEDHWARVNAALVALGKPPLTLGDFTLALLQAARAVIETKNATIRSIQEGLRPLKRAEMERLYGDVPDDEREDDSIVSFMQGYTITIKTRFPSRPLVRSLPSIFPTHRPTKLTTFRFNWVAQGASNVKTWIETPDLPDGAVIFLKEGAFEQTQPFSADNPGGTQVHLWTGVQVIDGLDALEIHDADGTTIGRGDRDPTFAEPPEPE